VPRRNSGHMYYQCRSEGAHYPDIDTNLLSKTTLVGDLYNFVTRVVPSWKFFAPVIVIFNLQNSYLEFSLILILSSIIFVSKKSSNYGIFLSLFIVTHRIHLFDFKHELSRIRNYF